VFGAFTPDGARLIVASVRWSFEELRTEVASWGLAERKRLSRVVLPDALYNGPATVTADGRLAVWRDRNALFVFDVDAGEKAAAIPLKGVEVTAGPVFSRDGRLLAFATSGRGHAVRVFEWASRAERHAFPVASPVSALAFSPDGRRLASGHDDTTILVWGLTGPAQPATLARLGRRLRSGDAALAGRAIAELASRPADALKLTRDLRPAPRALAARRMLSLISDLRADQFESRAAAEKELRACRHSAESLLREALAGEQDLEVKLRLRRLLVALHTPAADEVYHSRCIEVLERVGTPAALGELMRLATGEPTAVLTREAAAAARRLAPR
jgi:hypothetical protein